MTLAGTLLAVQYVQYVSERNDIYWYCIRYAKSRYALSPDRAADHCYRCTVLYTVLLDSASERFLARFTIKKK